jgi:hypothetical protein
MKGRFVVQGGLMRWLRLAALMGLMGLILAAPRLEAGPPASGNLAVPQSIDNDTHFDVNNIDMWVTNHGSFGWDLETGDPGTIFPKGTDKTVIFASGLWMGAMVDDDLRVTVGEYSQEYAAGVIQPDGTPAPEGDPRFRVYKINRGDDASNPDYADWPFDDGAPADTDDPDYNPEDPSTWKPLVLGDQTLWCVYNDAAEGKHTNTAGNTDPLGVEIRQTVFGYDRQPPLGNMLFVKLQILNKGGNKLDDAYVSVWCDPDLGGFTDDLVGCDTTLSLGYCYNATNDDELYGGAPPAVGYDFFQGPPNTYGLVFGDSVPATLPMTSFNKYINGTDPATPLETYNYMRGLSIDGSPVVIPCDFGVGCDPGAGCGPDEGEVTNFFMHGDPVTGEGWNDCNPADRRLMLNAGPFEMLPGDTTEVVVSIIVAQGTDRLNSVQLLKQYDEQAQAVFDLNFLLPAPPPRPTLYVRPYDTELDLIWGTEADGDVQISDELNEEYHFQGFNVYQGESVAGPWKKIFTYDVDDTIALIYNDVFDVGLGGTQRVIVQNGTNSGITHQVRIDQDAILGGPLVNFREYYFAVSAYSYEIRKLEPYFLGPNQVGVLTASLENSPASVTGIPKASTGVLEVEAEHVEGTSDGAVSIAYVVQDSILEHDYEVTFVANPDPEAADPFLWTLTDLTTSEVLLSEMTNQSTDFDSPETNGFVANVMGPPLAIKDWEWGGGDRWISWVDWGGSGFHGGAGLGFEFFGSNLAPADYSKTIEIRFHTEESEWSEGQTYRRDLGYPASGIGSLPLSAWDVTGGAERRLNVNFVENSSDDKPANLFWDPDESAQGGREYLYVMNSDYNGGVDYDDENAGIDSDVLWAAWTRVRPGHTFLESDAVWTFEFNLINTEEDVFEFTTYPAGTQVGTVISNELEEIRAVPNPYFNQSAYELNQFERVVRFINLPSAVCTIRIFNLAGELVRTIEKEEEEVSWVRWDLQNEQAIPVASGIYIYHVEAEGIGTEVGKVAVFIEKERLDRF